MKRIAVFLLILLLTGCSRQGDLWQDVGLEPGDTPKDTLAAAAFVGYQTEPMSAAEALKRCGLQTDPDAVSLVDGGGDEWYLLVPRRGDATVTIHTLELAADGTQTPGEQLCSVTGPVLLRCNPSDIISSVSVTITAGEDTVTFSPFISLESGAPMFEDRILDFTPAE